LVPPGVPSEAVAIGLLLTGVVAHPYDVTAIVVPVDVTVTAP
jgi:hypothetical protein